jgi:hypothetical protein
MDIVRKATPEEIALLADRSDLTPTSDVLTFGGKDFAVIRNCTEIDPMFFAEDSGNQRRLLFAMNLESILRFQGVQEIYFNVPVADTKYIKVLETWGASPTSLEPELRFKKVL